MNPVAKTITTWYRNVLRNPKYRWWVILGTLVYLFSPLDISPDLIPIVGQIDDVAILFLLVSEVVQMLSEAFQTQATVPNDEAETPPSTRDEATTVDVDAVSID
ncbi:MAG: DUF1232 domain-containing protein [Cyanobacteria bacterium SID2]|nr:DUF1232 domain-containing protein [Cyanobacteria bacterium SID2]MBP0002272.1 DUF1232 domain-containing protein [Cyanobacteria bacterium SBC]